MWCRLLVRLQKHSRAVPLVAPNSHSFLRIATGAMDVNSFIVAVLVCVVLVRTFYRARSCWTCFLNSVLLWKYWIRIVLSIVIFLYEMCLFMKKRCLV